MKKGIKKLLAVSLSLALIMVILPVASFTAKADTYGPFTYEVNDNQATITKVERYYAPLEIPETLNGFKVTKIAENAFCEFYGYRVSFYGTKEEKENLIIESGNENLLNASWQYTDQSRQFYYEITDDTVHILGVKYAADVLNIPAYLDGMPVTGLYELSYIGSCAAVTNVNIPNTVKVIGYSAFSGFYALSYVEIPESVEEIEPYAFANCYNLTSAQLPSSVEKIGQDSFFCCPSLGFIYVNAGNGVYHSSGNCLIETDSKALIAGCKNSVIPDDGSVTKISSHAFYGCNQLTEIVIPDSVTDIGSWAFCECYSLENIVLSDSVVTIQDGAFSTCWCLGGVYYTGSFEQKQNISISALANETLLNAVWRYNYIPGTPFNDVMHSDYYYYFVKNGKATIYDVDDEISGNITVPGELGYYPVTAIDKGAFSGCERITDINIPNSITEIVYLAFENCTGIKNISIPESVQKIEAGAFVGCESLENIEVSKNNEFYHVNQECLIKTDSKALLLGNKNSVIPNDGSVTNIVYYAFGGCSGLESINIPGSVTSIGSGAFSDCSGLKSINISDGIDSIGEWTFHNCSSLNDVSVPDSVTKIGGKAFAGCSSLKSVKLSNNIYTISDEMFLDCTSLVDIVFPENLVEISPFAFKNCTSLKNAALPEYLYSIGGFAFENCTSLRYVILPKFVHKICDCAFAECSSLSDVYYFGTEQDCEFIDVGYENGYLENAVWHYNYKGRISGDINGDGKINNKDLTRLFQYLSGWKVEVNDLVLDVNGDGKQNNKDLTRLFQYLSGWNVQIFY